MNRKIMLLPLTAALVFGLASCEDKDDSSVVDYDGGISQIEAGDVAISGLVAQKGTKGWMLDDGKASVYVFGALSDDFKVGDHVKVTGTCTAYWGLYEITNATVTANTKAAPTLADPVEITAAEISSLWNITSSAKQTDASLAPTKSKRYKLTGCTAESINGYAGFSVNGFTSAKLKTYYYNSAYNATAANQNTKLYVGCNYDVSFYYVGTGSDKNINIGIFDVTAHYDAVQSATITGDSKVATGDSITLTAAALPATADQGFTWSSSDESIATVSSYGKVTGVKEGSVTITATSTADNTKKAEIAITVVSGKTYNKVGALSYKKDTTVEIDDKLSDSSDPHITYTSVEGVAITVRKGSATNDVNVWKSDYSSCRWYAKHKIDISHANDFDRIVLTCDSDYANFANVSLPTGASYDTVDNVITITLASAVKTFDFVVNKQLRPSNVELKIGV